ncbi:MAG: response regulator [Fibrobacterota bacterium]
MAKCIIHIDDDADIRFAVKAILEKEGFEVQSYEVPGDMPETVKEKHPDLFILDIMMDEVDSGLKSYEEFKTTFPHVPVIFLTSLGDQIQAYFESKGDSPWIIEKPVTPDKILSNVKKRLA